jgi:hypothetical protein
MRCLVMVGFILSVASPARAGGNLVHKASCPRAIPIPVGTS